MVTDLAPFTVASITPVVVDPETLNIILNVNFKYDTNATSSTKETIESLVSKTVTSFNNDNLKVFSSVFRHSQFTGLVDDADPSILSNITTVSLGSLYTPNTAGSYSFTS